MPGRDPKAVLRFWRKRPDCCQSAESRKKKKNQHRRYEDTLTIIRFKANKVFSDGSASLHRAEHLTEMAKFTEVEITDLFSSYVPTTWSNEILQIALKLKVPCMQLHHSQQMAMG